MNVIHGYPPNYEEIEKEFNPPKSVVFTYGENLYSPSGGFISNDLMTHEETHSKQQGNNPQAWWRKYFDDIKFRISQEVEAYQNQYKAFVGNRDSRRKFLRKIANDLSSRIYGNVIRFDEAKTLIKNG